MSELATESAVPNSSFLAVAPRQVIRGPKALLNAGAAIAALGQRPFLVGGKTLLAAQPLQPVLEQHLITAKADYGINCSEGSLQKLRQAVIDH